ncbi:hypothetical protein M3I53_01230 [Paraburkholderia sp. CNPSo 3272]|uniref:hypothetical protein n=1 Tax=Paraburkholderia sp. CNPSo 3272 TaxID=2940931 RepID=UPI0020B88C95|nr:hypothetical protein [Paraburkholderia sp. CNPSo 3272]MCP3721759.1 hypothetical protein [Paraburkholderia sp. CNPSo 3272]
MATILTDERRTALGSLISEWFGKLDSDGGKQSDDGRIIRAFDYTDSRNIDLLIDEAIAPAIADAVQCALVAQANTVPLTVLNALRFYASGDHFSIDDDHQQFDTVSGEPQNWLFSERDDDCTMVENGGIAKAVLRGFNGGFEEAPTAIEGEVLRARVEA